MGELKSTFRRAKVNHETAEDSDSSDDEFAVNPKAEKKRKQKERKVMSDRQSSDLVNLVLHSCLMHLRYYLLGSVAVAL